MKSSGWSSHVTSVVSRGLALGACLSLAGCLLSLLDQPASFDQRTVTIAVLDLFPQMTPSRLGDRSWRGDWVFRRMRLAMIDAELRRIKPDVFVMQGVMARRGMPAESDRNILLAGALADAEYRAKEVAAHPSTNEQEFLAVAAGMPLRLLPARPKAPGLWQLGESGEVAAFDIAIDGKPATLLNVRMPPVDHTQPYPWYEELDALITERLRATDICPGRLIVAGYLPVHNTEAFDAFLEGSGLADVSKGSCQVAADCYTATPSNELFLATAGDQTPTQTDRILVSDEALVYGSARRFDGVRPPDRRLAPFGLKRLSPSTRYGWSASVRLPVCPPR